jgi:hypothetical protein
LTQTQKKKKMLTLALAIVICTASFFVAPSTSAPATAVQTAKGYLVAITEFSPDALSQTSASIGMLDLYGEGTGSPDGYVHYTKGGKPCCFPPIQGQAFGRCPVRSESTARDGFMQPDLVAREIETHDEPTDITKPMSNQQRILSLLVPTQQQQQQEQQQQQQKQRGFFTLLLIAVMSVCWVIKAAHDSDDPATASGASAGTITAGRTSVSLLEENMEEHHMEEHHMEEHHSLTTSPRLEELTQEEPRLEELIPEESLEEHHSHVFPPLPILILLLAMLTTSLARPLTAIEDARSTAFSSHFLYLSDKELREMTLVMLN